MTADRLAQGLREPEPADRDRYSATAERKPDGRSVSAARKTEPDRADLSPSTILAMCDRLLDEVGRRRHMFAWLHVPRAREAARAAPEAVTSKRDRPEPMPATWTPVKVQRAPAAPALEQGVGMVLGLMLAAALIAEVYLDVAYVFGAGRVILAFAIALEACSRALGTVTAAGSGKRAWAFACAIGGAPVVAWFALRRRSGQGEVDPAALAGLLAGLAGLLAVLALLIAG